MLTASSDNLRSDRHTASGDAFITAQVFLRLVRLAERFARGTLARVTEPFEVEV